MRVLGIDPGLSGALAVINDGDLETAIIMPTVAFNKKSKVDVLAIKSWLNIMGDIDKAYLELVHAMPGQGVSSTFRFGCAFAAVEAIVLAQGIPVEMVTPQAWKKYHNLIGSEKDAARVWASEIWPEAPYFMKKGKGQAIADAALIGVYGAYNG